MNELLVRLKLVKEKKRAKPTSKKKEPVGKK